MTSLPPECAAWLAETYWPPKRKDPNSNNPWEMTNPSGSWYMSFPLMEHHTPCEMMYYGPGQYLTFAGDRVVMEKLNLKVYQDDRIIGVYHPHTKAPLIFGVGRYSEAVHAAVIACWEGER